jgi:hypothetical protein
MAPIAAEVEAVLEKYRTEVEPAVALATATGFSDD